MHSIVLWLILACVQSQLWQKQLLGKCFQTRKPAANCWMQSKRILFVQKAVLVAEREQRQKKRSRGRGPALQK